ncbi:hypothetical protein JW998_02005 [candidate division KSB1 bacterium]|nr:hypothetical protein [candidate division KSB1 bacterium]
MTCGDERLYSTCFTCDRREDEVTILWNPSPLQLPPDMQEQVEDYWHTLPKQNIFNGRLARLDNWSHSAKECRLDLRPSDYRTLLYSNDHVSQICTRWGSGYLSRALGISAVLLSADDCIIFMRRSANVGEYPGCYDVFGGHIEAPANGDSPTVFGSMACELLEEVGLDESSYKLSLLGLIESTPNKKPELVFLARAFLTRDHIISRAREAKDHIEFTRVHALQNDLEHIEQFLAANKSQFSPSAFGSFCVYFTYCNDVRSSRGSEKPA